MKIETQLVTAAAKKSLHSFNLGTGRLILAGFLLIAVTCSWLYAGEPRADLVRHLDHVIKADDLFAVVKELSSETYAGRLTGTEGYNKAADFAARLFKQYGLLPINPQRRDYFQTFPISYTTVHEGSVTIFLEHKEGQKETINGVYFRNFYPLNFSGSGDVKGEIVFAGLGVTAPEYGYDDYRGIDARGKIVMIIKGVPRAKPGQDWSKYDSHRYRTQNARVHGAVGLLYTHHACANVNGDYLEDFPMVIITAEVADKILAANNLSFRKLWDRFDAQANSSYSTGHSAHIKVKSDHFQGEARNLLAYIPGSDPRLKDEFIVICAHLDHCGKWPLFTPGSNDNASGTAVVLTAARALASFPVKPQRSVLFILFAAEEMGLLGSEYFATHLPTLVKKIKFVINLDMVASGEGIFVMRLKNYPAVEPVFHQAVETLNLQANLSGNQVLENIPFSDYASFVNKGFPAVSIYSTGSHYGFHTNEDTIAHINPKIMEEIGKLVSFMAHRLANE